jgi:cation diffusion facilitator family transporter
LDRSSLTRFAWLSIAASLATIALKTTAYLMTGSVGFMSDAIESLVNLAAAIMALGMLIVAAQPADESHTYGHSKAEYFSSGTEGLLILVAAGGIIWTAVGRLLHPQPLEQLGLGLIVSVSAAILNLVVAQTLLKAGRRQNSITLEADAQHLMTDVWTSVGVIAGMGIVALTGWGILDPIIAIAVGLNIIWTGAKLVKRSVAGLMDASLPPEDQKLIEDVINKYTARGVTFHNLRTRQSAALRFVTVHMLVPAMWTVRDAHEMTRDFEADLRKALPETVVLTHLEPLEDSASAHHIDER